MLAATILANVYVINRICFDLPGNHHLCTTVFTVFGRILSYYIEKIHFALAEAGNDFMPFRNIMVE